MRLASSMPVERRIALLLWDADRLIGHIAAYIRPVLLGDEAATIGLIGDVAIEPGFQSRGHSKRLIREAHGFFGEASLPFSVLFAFEPERYRSSGYRLMGNETRFLDADGSGGSSSIAAPWWRSSATEHGRS
jgi:predicted acetyltransferase